ncbi:dTDP-4-dehydrorhamnose reductase [Hathewaya massiliensis]|uniref:dTDP-4-dehydrorhamnose reductase n=1 Tax=Hathewaya massiliensis TaxID=1964382 RepID=UPI00115ACAF3|nr:dTDP-4-dehydrorhamnose reductase [Hathewaya massiliensis]
MKILITGAGGQLATEVCRVLKLQKSSLGAIPKELLNTSIVPLNKSELDISNLSMVEAVLKEVKPDVVINCAAYTKVDLCESESNLAFKVNSLGPRNLAIICEQIGAKLVHISTDYVFSGEGNTPFKEYHKVDPKSVYGKTKLLGEEYVREFSSRYFIIRTSWLYGKSGKNFVYTIIKNGREKGKLKVVNDQVGSPTNCEDLAYHILKLLATKEYGIYNCAGKGPCTWYDFACKIIQFSGIDCEVSPCSTGEFPTVAERPKYSYLENQMLKCTIGDNMRTWEEALKDFIDHMDK